MSNGDVFINHYEFNDIEGILTGKYGTAFKEYRRKFNKISDELLYNDIPMYIVLSVNSYCNLRCKMCMRSFQNSELKREDLPLDTIRSITEQCKELGIPSIFLGATSECLLRKDIKEVIKCIRESGTMDNFLITNGTRLDKDMCNYLVDLEYERIYISLDAATKETYAKIRGGDLDLVEKNIERLLEIRNARGKKLPIIRVSFVRQKENEHELEDFINKWKDKVDLVDIQNLIDYSDFDNLKEIQDIPLKNFKCPAPFRMLYIDYHGDIYSCASDYCYHMRVGNISEMSIFEAWNSPLMNELRKNIKEGKLNKICANCANCTDN